jgi:hypothetical protein
MGNMNMCCGIAKENSCEVLILGILKSLKLTELSFNQLYEILTQEKFPDVHHSDKMISTVPSDRVKKVFDNHFVNPKSEFLELQKTLGEKMFKRILRKGEESVSLLNVMLRFLPYLTDDNHDKVFFFFAISNTSFKMDDDGKIQIESIRMILDKLMKYNLLQLTNDLLEIITSKEDVYKGIKDDVNKVRENYKESNVMEFFDARFTFENKFETLDKIVRTIKANYVIFDCFELRPTYIFYFLKKEKDNALSVKKN